MLKPRVTRILTAAWWALSFNQRWFLQKTSGSIVRTHLPMVLLAFLLMINLPPFLCKKVYLFSLHEGPFIVLEAMSPLMVGGLFWLFMMALGNGRAIIVGDGLLSFLSFRSTGGGMRAVTGCLRWLSMVP